MILHGILHVINNESRLDDGTLLANCAASSPLFAGTAFLQNRQCVPGDFIVVTGAPRTIGNVAVFCMDDAKPVGESVPNLISVVPKKSSISTAATQTASAPPKNNPPTKAKAPGRPGRGAR